MRRIFTILLWVALFPVLLQAQYTTPNQQFHIPPFNAAGWNSLINSNFTSLDNIFSGITPTIWKPRLSAGNPMIITDASGNPLFKVDPSTSPATVTVYGNLVCTGTNCGGNGGAGGTIISVPTFSLASGTYTTTQTLTLTSAGNTISWCTTSSGSCTPNTAYTTTISVNATEMLCANASNGGASSTTICQAYTIGSSGTQGGGAGTDPGTNIGTVARNVVLSTGAVGYKTCYVGGSVCSGGVGSQAPSSTPQRTAGLNTPSASSGTSNAVESMSLSTAAAQPTFTSALWTTSGGGAGTDSTSTNWYRDFYVKTNFPTGHTHFEFDTYAFDDGWDWMWGTQCNNTSNLIQYTNQNSSWVTLQIPCSTLYDGNYHHIKQTMHRDLVGSNNCANSTAPCQWWDTIVIDGTVYAMGKSFPATTSSWTGSGGQIQFDTEPVTASGGSPATAQAYVDTDTVEAGSAPSGTTGVGNNGGTTAGTGELDSFNFDSGTLASMGLTIGAGTPAIESTVSHSSPNGIGFPANANSYVIDTLSGPAMGIYSRQYIQIGSLGSNASGFLRYYHSGAEMFSFFFNASNGYPTVFDQANSTSYTLQATSPAVGSVHLYETYVKVSATAGQIIAKIDGTVVYTGPTNINTGTTTVDTVWFGSIGATAPAGWGVIYQDNVDFSAVGWIGPI